MNRTTNVESIETTDTGRRAIVQIGAQADLLNVPGITKSMFPESSRKRTRGGSIKEGNYYSTMLIPHGKWWVKRYLGEVHTVEAPKLDRLSVALEDIEIERSELGWIRFYGSQKQLIDAGVATASMFPVGRKRVMSGGDSDSGTCFSVKKVRGETFSCLRRPRQDVTDSYGRQIPITHRRTDCGLTEKGPAAVPTLNSAEATAIGEGWSLLSESVQCQVKTIIDMGIAEISPALASLYGHAVRDDQLHFERAYRRSCSIAKQRMELHKRDDDDEDEDDDY